MSTLSMTADQTYADAFASDVRLTPKIKFNPTTNTLNDRIAGLKFTSGSGAIDTLSRISCLGTGINENEAAMINAWDITAAYQHIKLPTVLDYEDLEELNDLECTENLLYKTSKKFSW